MHSDWPESCNSYMYGTNENYNNLLEFSTFVF